MPWYRHHYRDMALLIYLRFFVNIAQTALYSDINSHNTPFNMLRTTTSAFDASVSNLVLHICTGCVFVPSVFSRGQNGKVSLFLHTGSRNLLSGSVHISGIWPCVASLFKTFNPSFPKPLVLCVLSLCIENMCLSKRDEARFQLSSHSENILFSMTMDAFTPLTMNWSRFCLFKV